MTQQLFPLPATQREATAYLARLDQLAAEWRGGSGHMLGFLRRLSAAVEASYDLLPE